MRAVLGPRHELHVGIHGTLRSSPPTGVEYLELPYDLRFLHATRERSPPFSPAHDYAFAEWVRFHEGDSRFDVVHSSMLPVETTRPWVVDADSLMLPLEVGRFFALASAERFRAGSISEEQIRFRASRMLCRYADPGCSSVLFHTEWARRELLDHVERHGLLPPAATEEFERKCRVIRPAVPAPIAAAERPQSDVPSILYMGRTFEDKGGLVAAAALLRLREQEQLWFRAAFVGGCPEPLAARLRANGVRTYPVLDRSDYLELLAQADVFLSPTSFESYGMALVEAAAAGAAIVCSSGPGMEHVGELLEDGRNALFVSNALPLERRVAATVEALSVLLRDSDARRRLGANNRALTTRGALSIERRNASLVSAYDEALRARPGPPEPHANGALQITDWPQVLCDWELHRRAPAAVRIRV